MAFTALQIMKRASVILQDKGAVRWTASELADWLNEAQRAVVLAKPDAKSGTVTLPLARGTRQELPGVYTTLASIVRNSGGDAGAVRAIAHRELLDAHIPGWHSNTGLPFASVVSYVWQDDMSPREFYVVPGNDGTGSVEAVVGMYLPDVPLPKGEAGKSIDSYTAEIDMENVYQGVLLDLLLARAFSKDSAAPDAAGRSQNRPRPRRMPMPLRVPPGVMQIRLSLRPAIFRGNMS